MLQLTNLSASTANGLQVLDQVNLEVNPGQIVYLLGPNGSGKSSLTKVLSGHPNYEITAGKLTLDGIDLTTASASERAQAGILVAFQYPVEIPGVNFLAFLLLSYNNLYPEVKLTAKQLQEKVELAGQTLGIKPELWQRNLNEDMSGGEKKQLEILQLAVLQPKYLVLDETDSGLDVDAVKRILGGINKLYNQYRPGVLVITHYTSSEQYLSPQQVYVLRNGRIVSQGGVTILNKIYNEGYESN